MQIHGVVQLDIHLAKIINVAMGINMAKIALGIPSGKWDGSGDSERGRTDQAEMPERTAKPAPKG